MKHSADASHGEDVSSRRRADERRAVRGPGDVADERFAIFPGSTRRTNFASRARDLKQSEEPLEIIRFAERADDGTDRDDQLRASRGAREERLARVVARGARHGRAREFQGDARGVYRQTTRATRGSFREAQRRARRGIFNDARSRGKGVVVVARSVDRRPRLLLLVLRVEVHLVQQGPGLHRPGRPEAHRGLIGEGCVSQFRVSHFAV